MDDQGSHRRGRRPDDAETGDERARETDQEYYWGGKPGEDFGPLAPPGPLPTSGQRRPVAPRDLRDETARTEAPDRRPTARRPADLSRPLRPDGVFTAPAAGRRRWGPVLAMLGALVLLGVLAGAALLVISRPGMLGLGPEAPVAAPAAPVAPVVSPAPAAASPVTAPKPAPAAPSPAPAASPTPLTIGAPSPPPAPKPAGSPAPRVAPAIMPTPPALVTPPGLRFPTATPARIGSPQAARTPPPIPPARLPNVLTRVWSEQVVHRVGDDASICGQTNSGASAQLIVIAPDRSPRTLGEFATPADRVCHTLNVDQPDLWVLTLIIRDADAKEIDRQSAALWVSR